MGSSPLASSPGQFNKYLNREAACRRGSHLSPWQEELQRPGHWSTLCPRAKALISSDETSSPSPASPPPPSLTVTQRGTCEGTANFCRRMQLPGARGLHVSCKELSPLSLGQALRGETPSSCWAISFQLCPNIAVYSFTEAAPTAPSPPLPPTCSSLSIPDP